MCENTNQKNSEYGRFLRGVYGEVTKSYQFFLGSSCTICKYKPPKALLAVVLGTNHFQTGMSSLYR